MNRIEKIVGSGKVSNKKDYYFLYSVGFFGNKPLTWNSLEEIKESGWNKGICIRSKQGVLRSKTVFDLTMEEAINYIEQLRKEGIKKETLTFNQSMPNEELKIQGEIMRSKENYSLTYTTIKKPMNRALEEETLFAKGLTALSLVKENLFPSSYEDLQDLFNIFPDSIIEFSSYNVPVGNLKNRNTILWEVRNY